MRAVGVLCALVACSSGTAATQTKAPPLDAGQSETSADAGSCAVGVGVLVPAAERISNGHPLLPPKWAFGILWGSYYDQIGSTYAQGGNLLDAAAKLRAEYSGDLMWIDSSWLWHDYSASGSDKYICFAFDPAVFPDPQGMIATLRQKHFHFGVWEWPWMDHGCQYFATATTNRYFVMNGAQPALASGGWHGDPNPAEFDFTNPAAATWWTGLNAPFASWGLDFLKLDTVASQQQTPVTSGGGAFFDASKSYTHERNAAAYAATKLYAAANDPDAEMNGARGFIMPKAPSPGNDQLPGWWTDDRAATFAGMQSEMVAASQLDTSDSAAYWCGDTGGYDGTPTDELYARWLEYTTFTPLQEFFGSKTDSVGARFPWLFGAQAQQIQKTYADLRYQLLPFRYSNALAAYEALPVTYPVSWIGSTQLLVGGGDSVMLVQPVTTAGATTASVQLPAGGAWIHYWTGASYAGGSVANVAAPLDQEPVFVKAGAILPMGPSMQWVDQLPADPLTLDVYPAAGAATSYTLYEDDGRSEGYLGGAYATTRFGCDATGAHPVLTIGAQTTAKYAFTGQLACRTYVLEVHGQAAAPTGVRRDGHAVPMVPASAFAGGSVTEGWYQDGAAQVVWIRFPLASSASTRVSLD
ncbi:MAG TPA: TIM-barrel domain-containing protein [Polyangiaceae bacterium]